ncbi:MAG: DoxX family protein [Patescibacteria group bacterium]|nr:DoxX family protein [Patescibacteria group bacterium]
MDVFLSGYEGLVLLFARVAVALVMLFYGWPKMKSLKSNAKDFVEMGFKPGMFWGTIVAFIEFFGGIAMLIGFYAWVVAAVFGFQMIVGTFWKMKMKKPFNDYSYDMLLIALVSIIIVFGPGLYAIN